MNGKIAILNDLGDPEELDCSPEWPDYLAYGFTSADVPDLIAIIVDEEPNGKSGIWLHLHTWRTLGQLKAVDAIEPLITSFDFFSLVEDNAAFKELPEVIGMIGEPAIAPIARYLSKTSTSTFARSIANDALGNIAKQQPDCRDKVLASYKTYLLAPDCLSRRLNSFIIRQLLDLKAAELIEDIRPLFKNECVEQGITGELGDIEKKLLN